MSDKLDNYYRLLDPKSFRKFYQRDQIENYSYFEYCTMFVEFPSGDIVYVPDSLFKEFMQSHKVIY